MYRGVEEGLHVQGGGGATCIAPALAITAVSCQFTVAHITQGLGIALDRYSGPMKVENWKFGVKQLIQLLLSIHDHSQLTIYGASH